MTCFTDIAGLICLTCAWRRYAAIEQQRQQQRLALLQRLARRVLGHDVAAVGAEGGSEARLPAGADTSAANALGSVESYQEQRRQRREAACMGSSGSSECSAGPLDLFLQGPAAVLQRFFSAESRHASPVAEAEDVACLELRAWLIPAASCNVSASEVSCRLEFYRQVLMRPEVFGEDPGFPALLATVCERLDELCGRLAGASRSCASLLGNVRDLGRQLLDNLLPVLLLSICDAMECATLPSISLESLLDSASRVADGSSSQLFEGLWSKDCGCMLQALILTPHAILLSGIAEPGSAKAENAVLDAWLDLRHVWADALDAHVEDTKLPSSSGVHELFCGRSCRDVQQAYLDLYRQIDNLIKFLSLAGHYQKLANVAGDAAMYHMRPSLHHLLQEIELSMSQVSAGVTRIMQAVRQAVRDVTLGEVKSVGSRQLIWLERLQLIDEPALGRCCKALLETLQEIRYLSSEVRLPKLQDSCRKNLEQISNLTSSAEFRSRCTEAPPILQLPEVSTPDRQLHNDVGSHTRVDITQGEVLPENDKPQRSKGAASQFYAPIIDAIREKHPQLLAETSADLDEATASAGMPTEQQPVSSPMDGSLQSVKRERAFAPGEELPALESSPVGSSLHAIKRDRAFADEKAPLLETSPVASSLQSVKRERAFVGERSASSESSPMATTLNSIKRDRAFFGESLPLPPQTSPQAGALNSIKRDRAFAGERADTSAPTGSTGDSLPQSPQTSPLAGALNSIKRDRAFAGEKADSSAPPGSVPSLETAAHKSQGMASKEQQDRYYELFMGAVLPILGDGESLSGDQAVTLLQRAGLSEQELQCALLAAEVTLKERVGPDALRRLLELVAHCQAGCQDLEAARARMPATLPAIRGFAWNGNRLRVTESLV
eukprot:TRINITY_DN109069_c0_g1_i1.p1 TRINITY_DN109069_c0_g1~~TRINITY_DN109069_c0_g1_i1.p1  ORF type:complete len:894 (-),score=163.94 TRINITY_DN109069_c0_g1_i1:50-2731(-)